MKILLTTLSIKKEFVQLQLFNIQAYFNEYFSLEQRPQIDVIEFTLNDTDAYIAQKIIDGGYDTVGFSCSVSNSDRTFDISKILKKSYPDIKIVLGGPEVSVGSSEVLRINQKIDIIVRDEGERTFMKLIECMIEGNDISIVDGITYRKNDDIIETKDAELLDLDTIPSPFLKGFIDVPSFERVPLETLRGCPFNCSYCYFNKGFKYLRYYALDRIEKEMEYILRNNPRELWIIDPTFNIKAERAKDILRIYLKYNIDTRLMIYLKAELLDEELVALLSKCKISHLDLGVQSLNTKTINYIKRENNYLEMDKRFQILQKYDAKFVLQFIVGLPGETYDSFLEGIDWVYKFNPYRIQLFTLQIFKGTGIQKNPEETGIVFQKDPPYYILSTRDLTAQQIQRLIKMGNAIDMLYYDGLLRHTIDFIMKTLNLKFTDILEDWIDWDQEKIDFLYNIDKLSEFHNEIFETSCRFLKYYCQKKSRSELLGVLLPLAKKDFHNFCKINPTSYSHR